MFFENTLRSLRRWRNRFWRGFLSLWRGVPLLGRLADCTVKDHLQAAKEMFFSFAFSTVTFWLGAVIMLSHKRFANMTYWDLLVSTFSNGELLIFSVSFIGPIFLATLAERPSGKAQFPGREWHMIFFIVVALIASALFSSLKSGTVDPTNGTVNMDVMRMYSYFLAAGAVALRYLTLVYQKNMNTLDEYGPKDDNNFAKSYIAHAEDKGQPV